MSNLKKLLKEHNLKLVYKEIEKNGYILHTPCGSDLIFVKSGLSEEETTKVVLHEIGHEVYDDDTMSDYKRNPISRCKSEHGANSFLIHSFAEEYAESVDKENANYVSLANFLGYKDLDMVKDILKLKYQLDMPQR